MAHSWRANLAVLLAAATAGTVLTGALVVGDSVRGSLYDLALDRLGRIDRVLAAPGLFREALAADLEREGVAAAPLVLLRGSAVQAATRARASGVSVLGVDQPFAALYPELPPGALDLTKRPGQVFPSLVANTALARELGAAPGDDVLLSLPDPSAISRETLLASKDPQDLLATRRFTLVRVLPDRGAGRFGLAAEQALPRNAYVALTELQRAIDEKGKVNVLLAASGRTADTALQRAIRLEDMGLVVRPAAGHVALESGEYFLDAATVRAAEEAATALGAPARPVFTYLATQILANGRLVPYSLVSALDPTPGEPAGPLRLADGSVSPAPGPGPGEILLDDWTAADLGAKPGDAVELRYFVPETTGGLRTERASFRLRAVVAKQGLAADRTLTPAFPGLEDADDIAAWSPPFPVDLALIRPRDEEYWDRYREAPKAFLSLADGRRLWGSRFGDLTSVRVAVPPGEDPAAFAGRFRQALRARLDPAAAGLSWRPVREEGLRAAAGATDFAGLFLGFSLFLIAAAALLVGLLFALGVERRARELGLLRALGFPLRAVRRRLLAEGAVLAGAGALLGTLGALAYAALLLAGLRTWWLPAVGTPLLSLHARPATLALGAAAGAGIALLAVWITLRRLRKVPETALLAGSLQTGRPAGPPRLARAVFFLSFAAAAGVGAWMLLGRGASSPALAFGLGASLLAAGLAGTALALRRATALPGGRTLAGMGARNGAASQGRSLLSVALVASASFVLVVAAANRREPEAAAPGGFALAAESAVPLYHDPGTPAGRAELGFPEDADAALAGVSFVPFRVLPGDDASCLNLYRPQRPRLLGVPADLIARGGPAGSEEEAGTWRLLAQDLGPGVIPAIGDAESVKWILHLDVGGEVALTDEAGRPVRLRIVGLLHGSPFQSELLVPEAALLRHFPGAGRTFFLIRTPTGRETVVARALEENLAPWGFDATSLAERLAAYREVQNTYLATFQALGGLGLLLGTLGLALVLLRNAAERRGELAMLRAFGFRRRRLAALLALEAAALLLAGLALGTAAGLLAALPHLAGTAAGLPWRSLAATLAAVLAFGLLASVATAWGALRAPLLPALKAER